ncbi:flagellar biosynthesis anti-sigma factor FlgM [Romboutsia sedimentorum]|uniref:flagellar biosynthesis anti-sigma factor FlgM n=1 Tax=Romboutsia sedimentorum TaxID=1368474 RepID=UPI0024DEADC7|nr:flagellar biosynthesis anti-sigma factor FlgM [Romboutsia sedimentorum]MDK2585810.1 flagellar biosynthesis anti-sigma factor FlgM [Romboutsia sedimentorum]
MNITSVNFRGIENMYKNNKVQAKPVNNKIVDSVEISELGKQLNKLNTNKEDVNIDKINEIKTKIENGTYKVDSKDLAKKIIESMRGDK